MLLPPGPGHILGSKGPKALASTSEDCNLPGSCKDWNQYPALQLGALNWELELMRAKRAMRAKDLLLSKTSLQQNLSEEFFVVSSTQHLSGPVTTFRPLGCKETDVWVGTGIQSAFHTSSGWGRCCWHTYIEYHWPKAGCTNSKASTSTEENTAT